MEIKTNAFNYEVVVDKVKMDVSVNASAPLQVNIGESAKIDVGQAINYIKSGEAEIQAAVQDGKAAFNLNAVAKTNEFNANASDKTGDFNDNYTAKLGDFNTNATNKTGDFNDNYTSKLGDFNTNASNKTTDFNDNYVAKKALIDAEVENAQTYAATAKQYAIGDPSEPIGNSAKYWAEQASSSLSGLTSRVTTIEGKIPSAASSSNQLADKEWVGNQGYITGITSGDVTTALGYTPYNSTNPDGYISGITSGDVTTALGYTPYDASNPNGYTSNVGTVTSVNNTSPDNNGNVTLVIPTVNDATLTINQGGTLKGTFTANASSNVTIDLDSGGGASRNIGEIVASTIPLTDAGLHLLDGSLIPSGSYADFVDYIGDLYDSGNYSDIFDTEANWQTAVTTYGVCGKFVYDSVNGTVRLPKISGFIEGTLDATKLGDLVTAGLPDIEGQASSAFSANLTLSGAFYKGDANGTGGTYGGTTTSSSYKRDAFKASLYNSIYGNSTTVQPQSIKVLYYIVIATSVKTEIEVDIDQIATDLNGKADVDLSNVGNSGTALSAGWAMPSDTYDDLTLGASGASYQAPANGWFTVYMTTTASTSANSYVELVNNSNGIISKQIEFSSSAQSLGVNIATKKGDSISFNYADISSTTYFRFVYAVGSEWEKV